MKLALKTVVMIITLAFAAMTGLTGCATTGAERSAKTTNTMQTVGNDYQQVAVQVDATNAALQDLINPNQPDMRKSLDNYKTNVAKMEKLGNQLDRHSNQMNAQGQNYFSEWEKQGNTYTNPQVRALSEQRRVELRQVFAEVPEASIGVKGTLRTYISDIKDIQKYLSNDLTPKGVEAVTPIAQKAMQDGEELKSSVKPVVAAIDRVRNAMARGGDTGGAAAGGEQSEEQPNPHHNQR